VRLEEILVEKQFKDLPSWANKLSDPTHGGGKLNAPQGDFVPPAPYEYAVGLPGVGVALGAVSKVGGATAKVIARVANRGTTAHKSLSRYDAKNLAAHAEKFKINKVANKAFKGRFPKEIKIDQRLNRAQRRLTKALLQTGDNSARTAKAAEKLRHQYGVAQQTRHLARNADAARNKLRYNVGQKVQDKLGIKVLDRTRANLRKAKVLDTKTDAKIDRIRRSSGSGYESINSLQKQAEKAYHAGKNLDDIVAAGPKVK